VSEHNPSLVLDITGGSKDQGATLTVWPFHGGDNQQFKVDSTGALIAKHSQLALDVRGGLKQGADIIQWPSHGGANQKWRFFKDGSIRLENNNLCFDIKGAARNQGAPVIAWPANGQTNQKWRACTRF